MKNILQSTGHPNNKLLTHSLLMTKIDQKGKNGGPQRTMASASYFPPRRWRRGFSSLLCTALLVLTGLGTFLEGFLLLVRSPAACDGVVMDTSAAATADHGTTISGRRLLAEITARLVWPGGATALAAARLDRLFGAAGVAPTVWDVNAPPATSRSINHGRQLSCSPSECTDALEATAAMRAVHTRLLEMGDIGLEQFLQACELWYNFLDLKGRPSIIQDMVWAEFVDTSYRLRGYVDGFYSSAALPAGFPPRVDARLFQTIDAAAAADGSCHWTRATLPARRSRRRWTRTSR